jgi:hypothetical protein
MKSLKNGETGFMTMDFLFALTIGFGFTLVFFAISYTLVTVEISQYIAFASSRAYDAANETVSLQEAIGLKKYQELISTQPLKNIYSMGWIKLGAPVFGDFSNDYPPPATADRSIYVGAHLQFEAKVLNLNLPLLGKTETNSSTGKATLNSYLGREVSTTECRQNFTAQRFQHLLQLNSRYRQLPNASNEALITDNGC